MNKVSVTIPAPIIVAKYFKGYCPMKTNIQTIAKIKAVVEKLAGKISSNTKKTGIHNSINEDLKVNSFSLIFAKYLAT